MKVELIYDTDCSNARLARVLLIKAFARTGVSARWLECDRASPASPGYARAYGSPTTLIDGEDVAETGAMSGSGARSVHSDGADQLSGIPLLEMVASALLAKAAPATLSEKGRW